MLFLHCFQRMRLLVTDPYGFSADPEYEFGGWSPQLHGILCLKYCKVVLLLWFLTVTCSCCPYLNFGSPIMWVTGSRMTTCLGKSCSFGLPRVPFVNCCQFLYLVISLLVLRAGYGIWLCQFLIIAYLFTLFSSLQFKFAQYHLGDEKNAKHNKLLNIFCIVYWAKILTDHQKKCDHFFVAEYFGMTFGTLNDDTV